MKSIDSFTLSFITVFNTNLVTMIIIITSILILRIIITTYKLTLVETASVYGHKLLVGRFKSHLSLEGFSSLILSHYLGHLAHLV